MKTILAIVLAITVGSCGWWSTVKTDVGTIAVDCSPPSLLTGIEELVPVAIALIDMNVPAALDALGKIFGDAWTCAVGVIAANGSPPASQPGAAAHGPALNPGPGSVIGVVIPVPQPLTNPEVAGAVVYLKGIKRQPLKLPVTVAVVHGH